MDEEDQSFVEKSQGVLDEKFVCDNRKTYFRPKPGSPPELFYDGSLSIKSKILSSDDVGHYLFVAADENSSRDICLPVTSFYEVNHFLRVLSASFGSGTFMCGDIKKNDLRDYFRWLKDEFQASGLNSTRIMAPFVGFMHDQGHWVLNKNLHLSHNSILDEDDQVYYIGNNAVAEFELVVADNLFHFTTFHDVFKRIVGYGNHFKINKWSFFAAMSFMIKNYFNNYESGSSNAGETRFCMCLSPEMSCGKSISMKILAYGQGVPSNQSPYINAGGDGNKSGTTSLPLKKRVERTNLFIFVNDYSGNKSFDELLLQCHDGFSQGSISSGQILPRASIFMNGNIDCSKRLDGRVLKFPYDDGNDFTTDDKVMLDEMEQYAFSNRGFLVAWCFYFSPLWLHEKTRELNGKLFALFFRNFKETQSREAKAWASTITAYFLLMTSVSVPFDMTQCVERVFAIINTSIKSSNPCNHEKLKLERFVIENIRKKPNKVKKWLKIGVEFTDKGDNCIKSIAISTHGLSKGVDINKKVLQSTLSTKYGKNCTNQTIEFLKENEKLKVKGYKIPEKWFTEEALGEIYTV